MSLVVVESVKICGFVFCKPPGQKGFNRTPSMKFKDGNSPVGSCGTQIRGKYYYIH